DELNHVGLDFIAKGSPVTEQLSDKRFADNRFTESDAALPAKAAMARTAGADHSWDKLAAQSAALNSPTSQHAPSHTEPEQASDRLTPVEQAALSLMRNPSPGNDVICIVRPNGNPQAQSEILVMDQATAESVQQLAGQRPASSSRQLTSLEVPRTSMASSNRSVGGEPTSVHKPSVSDQIRQRGPWWDDLLSP
ncbi:MAG TPA: hypothetical protein VGJ15_01125, partial [Pirellulales bacterium]